MTYSIASESLGGGVLVCFQACLLVCKGLGRAHNDVRGASQTTDVMPDMTNAYVKC